MTRLVTTEAAWGQIVNIGNDGEEIRIEALLALILRTAVQDPGVVRAILAHLGLAPAPDPPGPAPPQPDHAAATG